MLILAIASFVLSHYYNAHFFWVFFWHRYPIASNRRYFLQLYFILNLMAHSQLFLSISLRNSLKAVFFFCVCVWVHVYSKSRCVVLRHKNPPSKCNDRMFIFTHQHPYVNNGQSKRNNIYAEYSDSILKKFESQVAWVSPNKHTWYCILRLTHCFYEMPFQGNFK